VNFTQQLHTVWLHNLTHARKQVPHVRLLQVMQTQTLGWFLPSCTVQPSFSFRSYGSLSSLGSTSK
jgi:predicted cupin superfamily sugar epimerase